VGQIRSRDAGQEAAAEAGRVTEGRQKPPSVRREFQTTNLGVGGSNPSGRASLFNYLADARRTNL
jgi:hypothetical protein